MRSIEIRRVAPRMSTTGMSEDLPKVPSASATSIKALEWAESGRSPCCWIGVKKTKRTGWPLASRIPTINRPVSVMNLERYAAWASPAGMSANSRAAVMP